MEQRKVNKKDLENLSKEELMELLLDKDEEPDIMERPRRARSRRPGRNATKDARGRTRKKKGRPTKVQAMKIPAKGERKNKFAEMAEFGMHKKDKKVDKLLVGDNKPFPRDRASNLVEVDCIECGDFFQVADYVLNVDHDTGEIRYVCNDCSMKGE